MNNYKYKFSVVIPIYNVYEYVAETIESIINQTIGFKNNIQIILVNDGSPDNSEEICLEYVKRYPENIKYIKKENGGVSSARNLGIEYIEGKYVSFIDSDDKWEKEVFKKAWKMFENNEDLDVIGVRTRYFDALTRYHALDYKFDKDKIVDIFEQYDHIQLAVTSAFFRSSAIGDVRFDTELKYAEDAKFVTEILLQSGKLGIISSSLHLYRKRQSETSAIQTKVIRDDWYLKTPEFCAKYLIELSKQKFGYVIPYIQYYIAYEYQWRIREVIPNVVSREVVDKYLELSKEVLNNIDDRIFFEQKKVTADQKIEYLKFKYGNDITKKFIYNKKRKSLYYDNLYTYNLIKNKFINLKRIEINNNKINLLGTIDINIPMNLYTIYLVINNKKKIKLDLVETKLHQRKVFNYVYMASVGFDINVNLKNVESLHFEFKYKDTEAVKVDFNSNVSSKISSWSKIYYVKDNKIIYYYKGKIRLKNYTLSNKLYFMLRNLKFNILKRKYEVIFIRFLYGIFKRIKKKEIWIISDRPTMANDNGFALFKYLQDRDDIETYFVIDKKSDDYEKVKNTGKVLIYNSFKYKLYGLLSSKIISSQADLWVFNPCGRQMQYYLDLYNFKMVFLQHGITKNDISFWLNKYDKNISLFITSSTREYDSIVNNREYGFDENVVKLTGMPRYDLLENKEEKTIVLMPTWRANLTSPMDPATGLRAYNNDFKESEYFKFYNNLINDTELIKVLKEEKYKFLFVIHPCHLANISDFDQNAHVEIITSSIDYTKLFSKASLLISDYSSVVFDIAYLKKPIIYTQFDKEDFYKVQIYEQGYFKDEIDGFGPVVDDYENTIKEIIKTIKDGCKLSKKYENRIDEFYAFNDKNNCERVYNEIKKLK